MGDIVFHHPIGISRLAAVAGPVIPSGSVLDHAVSTAQLDAQHKGFTVSQAHSQEILKLYNATVKDGRFIRQFGVSPETVATQLNLPLSAAAAAEIKKASQLAGAHLPIRPGGAGPLSSVTVVCIAVVVVLCADTGPNARVIVDRSGAVKL
jgi:hypothetical protein